MISVTIITEAYNAEKTIKSAIESVLVETCHGASHCEGICGERDFEV